LICVLAVKGHVQLFAVVIVNEC